MICSVTNGLVVSQGFGQRLYSSILSQLGSHPLLIDMCGLGNAFKASACAQVSLIFQFLLDSQGLLDLIYTCVVSQSAKDVSSLSQLFYAYFNSKITLLNFWLLHHLLWTWTLSSSRQGYLKHFPLCPTKVKVKLLSRVTTLCDPMTPYQAPPSMGFSREEYWRGLPFPSPGDLPDPRIKPGYPALQTNALPSEPQGKPRLSSAKSTIYLLLARL